MKLFTRIKTFATSTIMAATILLGASMAPASAQVVVAPGQFYGGAGCPVSPYDLQNVLSGMYGVDVYRRPVNQFGFPVDIYGNCLTPAPVGEVFNYEPGPLYVNYLWLHFSYRYYYRPGFVHLYFGPGVIIHRGYGAIPRGYNRVIIQQNYHAPIRTVRPVGPSTTVAPGGTRTVRPGAPSIGTVPPTSIRPGGTPPASVRPPASVTPPRAAAPTNTFNRPTSKAPTSVTPPHASAPTHTFNRPHR